MLRPLVLAAACLVVVGHSSWAADPVEHVARVAREWEADRVSQELGQDAADGRLDQWSLFRAALVASGVVAPRELDIQEAHWRSVVSACRRQLIAGSPRQRAEQVLNRLHEFGLTGHYDAVATRIDQTLESGCYNCVSATLLYQCLCAECGMKPTAVVDRTHVFSRFPELELDVETTCADARRVDRLHATSTPAAGRRITPVQLLGKIYYNRGLSELGAEHYALAEWCFAQALRFDPADSLARDNRLATMNNWALALAGEGRYLEASDLVDRGRQLDQDYAPLRVNEIHIHHAWSVQLCQDGRYAEALQLLEARHALRPDAELFDAGRLAVYRSWVLALADRGQAAGVWNLLARARREFAGHADLADWEALVADQAARRMSGHAAGDEARWLLRQALAVQPGQARLEASLRDLTATGS